ncbi:beta-1,4-galactosyltransferase 4-like [Branchiostoma floridae x Branchiostoma japonicum]
MKNSSVNVASRNQSLLKVASSSLSIKQSKKTFGFVAQNISSDSSYVKWGNNASKTFTNLTVVTKYSSVTNLTSTNDTEEQQSTGETSFIFEDSWKAKLKGVEGGKWRPAKSRKHPPEKVAILVPYREREKHLKIFLLIMHPFLQRQNLDYSVYVIEQHGDEPLFCKGLLYNIGFMLAKQDNGFDCFIFHDVDLIPEKDENLYSCKGSPSHLSVAIDVYNYSLPYARFLGGVVALTPWQFEKMNGYSNLFCGWGGEDDDLFLRLYRQKMTLFRPDEDVGRYKMMRHNRTPENPDARNLLDVWDLRARKDGLNSLKRQREHFKITSVTREWLYTHILVNVGKRDDAR